MLSAVIITCNEEKDIARCLESVKWVDEIVVVDDFSQDRTVEICRRYTDKIFQRKWSGYGEQKNFAFQQCQGDWILSIDADEEASPGLKEEILKITIRYLAENIAGFYIPFRLNFLGKFLRFGGCQREKHLRLFRKGQGKFTVDAVHEKMAVDGKIDNINSPINHYSYDNLEDYFSKLNCYTSLAAINLNNKGKKYYFWQFFLSPWVFFQKYFLKLGFFDGWAGFLWAILSSIYVFIKYLKLWELRKSGSQAASSRLQS